MCALRHLLSVRLAIRATRAISRSIARIRYNPIQVPRIDVASFDAIFTEMSVSDAGGVLLVAAMSLRKPATMWTTKPPDDRTFAACLLHGIFPMAPAPSGDHSLGLDGLDQFLK